MQELALTENKNLKRITKTSIEIKESEAYQGKQNESNNLKTMRVKGSEVL